MSLSKNFVHDVVALYFVHDVMALNNELLDYYLNIQIYLDELNENEAKALFKVLNNPNISNTKKEDIVLGRVGQQTFRSKVINLWNGRCAVTNTKIMLTAGHIKPWRVSTNQERMDPYNGILLSPVYDIAFDKGYISFTNEGNILISKLIENEIKKLKISKEDHIVNLSPFSHKYLQYHRKEIFKAIESKTL